MGPLPPRPPPACGLPPISPALPSAHHLGCLCRAEPSRPGSGEAAGVTLTPPGGGAGLAQGVVSCSKTAGLACSQLGPPSHFNGPLDSGGQAGWDGGLSCLSAHRANRRGRVEMCVTTDVGVTSPGVQLGFCCVALGKSRPLSGCLSYKWTRLFPRSLKAVIPCTCPRMGDCPSRGFPSPYPAS